jgi:CRP/FNR family transcriptional regulator, polysaccharide utilization system transcription regulator
MKTILIIEDHWEIRDNVIEILELSGYCVLASESGEAGLVLAQNNNPDLILCDVAMPQMDGFEVLQEIKARPETAKIPFIFLTAKSEKRDLQAGLQLGADDYLVKPFEEAELLAAISMQFRKSKCSG